MEVRVERVRTAMTQCSNCGTAMLPVNILEHREHAFCSANCIGQFYRDMPHII